MITTYFINSFNFALLHVWFCIISPPLYKTRLSLKDILISISSFLCKTSFKILKNKIYLIEDTFKFRFNLLAFLRYTSTVWFIRDLRSIELITLLYPISYYLKHKCVIADTFEPVCISKWIYADLQVWASKERYKCPFSRAANVVARSILVGKGREKKRGTQIYFRSRIFLFSL